MSKKYKLKEIDGIPHKSCSRCNEFKPYSAFGKSSSNIKLNLSSVCRKCQNYANQDSYHKHEGSRWLSYRAAHLKKTYNMSLSDYDKMLALQEGLCKICRLDFPGKFRKHFSVDHDHVCCPGKKSCGKCIRGLVCETCNRGMGLFKDNIELIEKVLNYLRRYRENV